MKILGLVPLIRICIDFLARVSWLDVSKILSLFNFTTAFMLVLKYCVFVLSKLGLKNSVERFCHSYSWPHLFGFLLHNWSVVKNMLSRNLVTLKWERRIIRLINILRVTPCLLRTLTVLVNKLDLIFLKWNTIMCWLALINDRNVCQKRVLFHFWRQNFNYWILPKDLDWSQSQFFIWLSIRKLKQYCKIRCYLFFFR